MLTGESFPSINLRNLDNPNHFETDEDLDWLCNRNPANVRVTETTARGLSTIWRGIQIISDGLTRMPLLVKRRLREGNRVRGFETVWDHPLMAMFEGYADKLTSYEHLIKVTVADVILHGAGYGRLQFQGPDDVTGVMRMDPRSVKDPEKLDDPFVYYDQGGKLHNLQNDQIAHVRHVTRDGIEGLGLIRIAQASIGEGIAARDYAAYFFSNAAAPQSVIEVEHKLSRKQVGELKQDYEAMAKGVSKSHTTAILHGGAKLKPFSLNPAETALLESRKFSIIEIANFIGVPPHKLGDDTRTSLASLESEERALVDDALDPWAGTFEDEYTLKLLSPAERSAGLRVRFDRKALVRANLEARTAWYTFATNHKVLNPNDVLISEGEPTYPGGEEYLPSPTESAGANPAGPAEETSAPMRADARRCAPIATYEPGEPDNDSRRLAEDALRRFVTRVYGKMTRMAEKGQDVDEWLRTGLDADFYDLAREMAAPACRVLGLDLDEAGILGELRTRMDSLLDVPGSAFKDRTTQSERRCLEDLKCYCAPQLPPA